MHPRVDRDRPDRALKTEYCDRLDDPPAHAIVLSLDEKSQIQANSIAPSRVCR
jgi:hypothetical protein